MSIVEVGLSPKTGSLHLAIATAFDRLPLVGIPAPLRSHVIERIGSGALSDADPEDRVVFLRNVMYAWTGLAFCFGLTTLGLAYIGDAVGGKDGRTLGIAVGAGLATFCLTGGANALWRFYFAIAARKRAKKYGVDSERYAKATRHTTLRNTSLVAQTVFAAVAVYLVLK